MKNRWLLATGIGALLALTACGGGGGGGGGGAGGGNGGGGGGGSTPNTPLRVTVPSPISGSISQMDLPDAITFTANVSGTTSATTIYVVVVDSASTFDGAASVSQLNATQYQAAMPLAATLTMGNHSGNLTISLCSDPGCATLLARTTAPYVVTITDNPVLTGSFSRASLALTSVRGDEPVTYPVRLETPLSRYLNYGKFSDPANVLRLAGDSQIIGTPWGSTDFEVTVSPDVLPGTYSGNLEMIYCRGAACERQYRGVTRLPYTVTVYPQTNLKALAPLPDAADWTVLQGATTRTGHVPATLNAANFSPRWLWRSPDPTNLRNILEPVNIAGKVITVAAPSADLHISPVLFAIDEASGGVSWQQSIVDPGTGPWNGGLGPLTPPAIAAGNVYVARTVGSYPNAQGTMVAFRVADGVPSPTFAPPTFAQTPAEFGDFTFESGSGLTWISPVHLTPRGNSMMLTGRTTGVVTSTTGIAADLTTGATSTPWSACIGPMTNTYFGATAAIDGNGAAYLATSNGLLLADTCETIATAVSLADGFGPVVVPGTTTVVAIGQGNLAAFDVATRQVKWSVPKSNSDTFVGSPAVADGTVFVQNSAYQRVRLEARRETDGEVLWTWQPPWNDEMSLKGNVVSTNNLVFVSTRRAVYAIDRATHQAVWSYPYGGKLSISANGVLYVRRGFNWSGTALTAINLQ